MEPEEEAVRKIGVIMSPQEIRFGGAADAPLLGELHRPDGEGPFPVVIGVHGGAWLRGHRHDLRHWGRFLADHGIALFSIDYALATKGPSFPQNLADVRAAVQFVLDESAGFGLDRDRIGILGASAGAHLAALTALGGGASRLGPGFSSDLHKRLRVLVGVYGVYDLRSHWQEDLAKNHPPGQDSTVRMLGADPPADPQLFVDASPYWQARYDSAPLKSLIIYGDADTAVSPDQSRRFEQALHQARLFARSQVIPGAGHFWFSDEPLDANASYTGAIAPRLLRFLQQHLVG